MTEPFTSGIKAIEVHDKVDVTLIQDSLFFAEIIYGENLIEYMDLEVVDETLHVRDNNRCPWTRPRNSNPTVILHTGALQGIYSRTSGDIQATGFMTDSLNVESWDASGAIELDLVCRKLNAVHHSGISEFKLSGIAEVTYMYASSSSDFEAEQLQCRSLTIHNEGSGDMIVRSSEFLFYQIYDVGNITVFGDPAITRWADEGDGQLFLGGE